MTSPNLNTSPTPRAESSSGSFNEPRDLTPEEVEELREHFQDLTRRFLAGEFDEQE